jgi:ArsR family metal-binding transcriptional regulator
MKFERDIGFKIFLSNNPSIAWNTNVMGDLVVYFYVDNTIYSEVEHFFEKNKDSTMVNMNELITLIQKKGKFRVLIVKESSLAKNILEEIKLFREK